MQSIKRPFDGRLERHTLFYGGLEKDDAIRHGETTRQKGKGFFPTPEFCCAIQGQGDHSPQKWAFPCQGLDAMETMLADSALGQRPTLLKSSKDVGLLEMWGTGDDCPSVCIQDMIDTAFLTSTYDFAAIGEPIHFGIITHLLCHT